VFDDLSFVEENPQNKSGRMASLMTPKQEYTLLAQEEFEL
jgi:hypothetical protein